MAHKRKKAAFYEVIRRTGTNPRYDKPSGQAHPQESGDRKSDTASFTAASRGGRARWPTRPRMLLFNAGQIEISLPYQLAVALLLGFILLILVAFRLGQNLSNKAVTSSAVVSKSTQKLMERAVVEVPQKAVPVGKLEPVADAEGNNRIVIQTWRVRAQLEPVKEYFARCGIETEIISEGDWYYLVTREKYDNPGKPGTDGYAVRQKIIELGAKYEPPPGSASFGPKPFHDAYGKRFDE
jgi:hypothetical protein